MTVIVFNDEFSICKLANFASIHEAKIYFCAKTQDEYSLVCPTVDVPADAIAVDNGWRAFRVAGSLEFALVGILARIATLLADNGISIFAVSTFDTDYVLTKGDKFASALQILEANGYEIVKN